MPAWRTSCAAMLRPLRHGPGFQKSSSTIISKAPCWSAKVTSSAFIPPCSKFAGRYRFDPRPVAVARGNEKGRVERAIRYVRDNFFAARIFADLDDLNVQ